MSSPQYTEEELIEALNEIQPDWREYWDTPDEAAEDLLPGSGYDEGDGYGELDFT
jgi:hypothetical protein